MPAPRKIKEYEIHPFAKEFREMTPEEFAALKASIKDHGQQVPAILYQGMILDGRHRYRACKELGIELDVEELKLPKLTHGAKENV